MIGRAKFASQRNRRVTLCMVMDHHASPFASKRTYRLRPQSTAGSSDKYNFPFETCVHLIAFNWPLLLAHRPRQRNHLRRVVELKPFRPSKDHRPRAA